MIKVAIKAIVQKSNMGESIIKTIIKVTSIKRQMNIEIKNPLMIGMITKIDLLMIGMINIETQKIKILMNIIN